MESILRAAFYRSLLCPWSSNLPTSSLRFIPSYFLRCHRSLGFCCLHPLFILFCLVWRRQAQYNNNSRALIIIVMLKVLCLSLLVRYCRMCNIRVQVIASSCLSLLHDSWIIVYFFRCSRVPDPSYFPYCGDYQPPCYAGH